MLRMIKNVANDYLQASRLHCLSIQRFEKILFKLDELLQHYQNRCNFDNGLMFIMRSENEPEPASKKANEDHLDKLFSLIDELIVN